MTRRYARRIGEAIDGEGEAGNEDDDRGKDDEGDVDAYAEGRRAFMEKRRPVFTGR